MGIGWVAIVDAESAEAACGIGPGGIVLGKMREGDGVTVKVKPLSDQTK